MAASYQLIIVFTISVIGVYGFYPGEKPILPIPTKCPKVDTLEYTVHIAHETNCSKFYKCFNGEKYEMDCPKYQKGLLHFNKLLQVCDYPKSAGCQTNKGRDDEGLAMKNINDVIYDAGEYADNVEVNLMCPKGANGRRCTCQCSCSSNYVCQNGKLMSLKMP
ncbi:PREDICTED: uncharacterized protein LOC107072609 [Polistes dominula]|uniref:Uncharacterized protein LOC107072609 n=1 Tax=Polistes dominula TaxID=743375 RepID=A0ABM1J6S9_POLDO|nr:PREDICTED: uncharacterized protein LOC107072609 [Polistes dominula]